VSIDDVECLGLRARKKRATRDALSAAALQLALERGLENVRVDDIAAAAGVSTRTYNNYFSSREEAICALAIGRARRAADVLRERPADEPLAEALTYAMVDQYAGSREPRREVVRLLTTSTALRGEFLRTVAEVEGWMAEAIAARTGTDAVRDLYPRVLAAVVHSAARVAVEFWLRPDCTTPFAELVRSALAQVVPATAIDRKVA
jgi:AcrR family transcriptional regulator